MLNTYSLNAGNNKNHKTITMTNLTSAPFTQDAKDTEHISLYLWETRSLFIGQLTEPAELTTAASCLFIGLNTPTSIAIGKNAIPLTANLILIPVGTPIRWDMNNNLGACCFLDPLGRDFEILKKHMTKAKGGAYYAHAELAALISPLMLTFHQQHTDSELAYQQLVDILQLDASPKNNENDVHLWRILDLVRKHHQENHSMKFFAQQLCLSEAALSTLFKQATGLSIRRYRNWHRIFTAAQLLTMGKSITNAAMEAGFTDAAHFVHVFRDMIGIRPSSIQHMLQHTKLVINNSHQPDKPVLLHE